MTTDQRFDRLEQMIGTLDRKIAMLENQVQLFASTAVDLETRLPSYTKAFMEFGAVQTDILRGESAHKVATINLAARVEKLEQIVTKLLQPAA
jgi:hypothetical protein